MWHATHALRALRETLDAARQIHNGSGKILTAHGNYSLSWGVRDFFLILMRLRRFISAHWDHSAS